MKTEAFKICSNCDTVWNTREDFLSDPDIELAGYQVAYRDLEAGLFFFRHMKDGCYTTLALEVKDFTDLSDRPVLSAHGKPPAGCPGFCVRKDSLEVCPEECECVWVRDILQLIRTWKKKAA